jgi:antitoxin (DNA-binding transcriptional repressor) of toxin-antitoxin stability system
MSFVYHAKDGDIAYAEEKKFHRRSVSKGESVKIVARDEPVAIWVPSNSEVTIQSDVETVIDVSEVVQHEDIVSMEKKIREMRKKQREAERREKRSRRRLRGLDRVTEE